MTDDCDPTRLSFACVLDHPPEKVWRALTRPDIVATWLAPNDLRATEGARFTLTGAGEDKSDIACEVIDAEPQRMLRCRWSETDRSGDVIGSTVTFTLEEKDGGTLLRVTHDGFARTQARARQTPPLRAVARNASRTRVSAAPKRRAPGAKPVMRLAA
ncbi:MAG: SRPBCC domain-containing protein [Rhizobiales bacterium]|nr:SRPBCC domain-containing protein [Hyphomicrobiales bacterium]